MEGWLPGADRERMGSYFLIGTEFRFRKMKRVLEVDSGDAQ